MKQNGCQANGCGQAAEVTVTRDSDGVSARFCRIHARTYLHRSGMSQAPDAKSGLAPCPRCGRAVGHSGRAAHNTFHGTPCE